MPDRAEKLRATLAELEAELQSLDSFDDDTRAILEEAAADIGAALRKAGRDDFEPDTLASHLKHALRGFEAEHPTLASIVNRMIDGLGQMGI